MPKCYFLIGPPGCGKTTWRLNTAPDAAHISTDDILEEIAERDGMTYSEAFSANDFSELVDTCRARLAEAIIAGRDIVIDQTNGTVARRKLFRSSIPSFYETIGVVFDFDEMELYRRVEERGRRTGKVISPSVVEQLIRDHSIPRPGEFDHVDFLR